MTETADRSTTDASSFERETRELAIINLLDSWCAIPANFHIGKTGSLPPPDQLGLYSVYASEKSFGDHGSNQHQHKTPFASQLGQSPVSVLLYWAGFCPAAEHTFRAPQNRKCASHFSSELRLAR